MAEPGDTEAREALADMMIRCSLATGHGETHADLVTELEWQLRELRRERDGARQQHSAMVKRDGDWFFTDRWDQVWHLAGPGDPDVPFHIIKYKLVGL